MTTRSQAIQDVRQALEAVKHYVGSGSSARLSESDTRAHFIDPILNALGYRSLEDIKREFFVKDTKDFLDYVLNVKGQPRLAVEAKAIGHNLTEADAGQLVKYCSILGIEWAVVTNSQEWWLYHSFAQTALAGKLVFKLNLVAWNTHSEFDSLFRQLWLVSKEAFESSDGPRAWIRAQQLDAALRDALTNPKSHEVAYLRRRLEAERIEVTPEDIALWARSKLLEPVAFPGEPPMSEQPALVRTDTGLAVRDRAGESYWIVPASGRQAVSAEQSLRNWLTQRMWGFYESTPSRRQLREGDWVAFYATRRGVLAYAQVAGSANMLIAPSEWPEPYPQEKPIYKLPLRDVEWLATPLEISAKVRASLDAFKGRAVEGNWSWIVQTTRRLTAADFRRVTGRFS